MAFDALPVALIDNEPVRVSCGFCYSPICAYPRAKRQAENRDGSGGESGRFEAFRQAATRSTSARFPGEIPKD